jgi:hypothetical protein
MAEKVDARAEAAESPTREIEHRSREIDPNKLRIRQSLEHCLRSESRTDPEIKDSSVTDLCRRK